MKIEENDTEQLAKTAHQNLYRFAEKKNSSTLLVETFAGRNFRDFANFFGDRES